MEDEIPVHYASYFPFERTPDPTATARAFTACGSPYAVLKRGVLWITRLVTDSSTLVTCELCKEADGWCVPRTLPARRGLGPWRVEGSCVVSVNDEMVAIVPPDMEMHRQALAAAPRMIEALRALARGEVDGARALAIEILGSLPDREQAAKVGAKHG
jgi:hypothetical protein